MISPSESESESDPRTRATSACPHEHQSRRGRRGLPLSTRRRAAVGRPASKQNCLQSVRSLQAQKGGRLACLAKQPPCCRRHPQVAIPQTERWTAPGLDDTSWLLLLMFVSAGLFFDDWSVRPRVAVRPLTAFRRDLSGIGWSHEGVLGSYRAVGERSTPTVEMRRVVSASEALGEIDATDPLAEIWPSSAGWATRLLRVLIGLPLRAELVVDFGWCRA